MFLLDVADTSELTSGGWLQWQENGDCWATAVITGCSISGFTIISASQTADSLSAHFMRVHKMQEVTVSSIVSDLLEQLGSRWSDFHEILYLRIFQKSVKKTEVSLKSDKNSGYFTWRLCTFMIISCWIIIRLRDILVKVVEKIKAHVVYLITFFWKLWCLWDVKKYGSAGQATNVNTVRLMRLVCQITKAADTHSEYVILTAFPRQQWLCKHALMLCLYVHCLSCSLQYHNGEKTFSWFIWRLLHESVMCL
jgi:hypothetical protein